VIEQGSPEWFAARCGKITASRAADVLAFSAPKMEWCVISSLNGMVEIGDETRVRDVLPGPIIPYDNGTVVEACGGGKTGQAKANSALKKYKNCRVEYIQTKPAETLKAHRDYMEEIAAEILTGTPKRQIKAKPLEWGKDVEDAACNAYSVETGLILMREGFVTHPQYGGIGCSPDRRVRGVNGLAQIKCPENSVNHLNTLRYGMPEEHMPQMQAEMFVTSAEWNDFVSFDPRMLNPDKRLYIQRIERDEEFIEKFKAACVSLWAGVQAILEEVA